MPETLKFDAKKIIIQCQKQKNQCRKHQKSMPETLKNRCQDDPFLKQIKPLEIWFEHKNPPKHNPRTPTEAQAQPKQGQVEGAQAAQRLPKGR